MLAFQNARQLVGEGLGLLVGDGRVQRQVNLQSLGAGGFGESFQAKLPKDLAQPQPNLAAQDNVGRRAGIEIEDQHGRLQDLLGQRERGMQLQVGEVGRPN